MPEIKTVREQIAWSYANLARAHAAKTENASSYGRIHHMIRSKLFKGLTSGSMSMRSLFDDEKIKLEQGNCCCYCGSLENLAVDHVIPRMRKGKESSDNYLRACRTCNSSKGGRDLLDWLRSRGEFPPLLLLRRYLKLVAAWCEEHDALDRAIDDPQNELLPFDIRALPCEFPPLVELRL